MVKLRYAGVRLAESEPPKSGQITLNEVKVGGRSVEFNGNIENIAGTPHTPKQWLEFRRRIDVELIRRKLLEEVGPPKGSNEGKSSSFLTNNTTAILKQDRGKLRKPPWWLGWLYSAVVTREEYDYD